MSRVTLAAALCLAFSAPVLAQDQAAIQELNDQFAAALNEGDVTAATSMYTEDAYLLPPGAPMVQGRDSVQAFWQNAMGGVENISLTTEDVKPLGDSAAREIGSFTITTKGDQPLQVTGKYVIVWEKVGDEWKLATDIWNMDQ